MPEEAFLAEIERLKAQLQVQAAVLRAQKARLAENRETFECASDAARIGLWECSLPDERLTWTGVVHDLFDLPRDRVPERPRTLSCYTDASRAALTSLRDRAIAEGSGFALDAEIVTPAGRHRWLRLTATVETQAGVPVRLFGMKQDITEAKQASDRLRRLAERDAVTGLANRVRFEERLGEPVGTLMLIDLDGFKAVNDTFGHAVGDACLRETAARLSAICRRTDLVARIGGDEFAIVLDERVSHRTAVDLAARIVDGVGRPITCGDRSFRVGASVGIARGGAAVPSTLFTQADAALYAAKAAGRNTFRIFTPDPSRHSRFDRTAAAVSPG